MRVDPPTLLLWAIAALLLLLAWLTVTGRLGDSRHGYGANRGADVLFTLDGSGAAPLRGSA